MTMSTNTKAKIQSNKQRRIEALTKALERIEKETNGYSAMSTMGCINEIAASVLREERKYKAAVTNSPAVSPEPSTTR